MRLPLIPVVTSSSVSPKIRTNTNAFGQDMVLRSVNSLVVDQASRVSLLLKWSLCWHSSFWVFCCRQFRRYICCGYNQVFARARDLESVTFVVFWPDSSRRTHFALPALTWLPHGKGQRDFVPIAFLAKAAPGRFLTELCCDQIVPRSFLFVVDVAKFWVHSTVWILPSYVNECCVYDLTFFGLSLFALIVRFDIFSYCPFVLLCLFHHSLFCILLSNCSFFVFIFNPNTLLMCCFRPLVWLSTFACRSAWSMTIFYVSGFCNTLFVTLKHSYNVTNVNFMLAVTCIGHSSKICATNVNDFCRNSEKNSKSLPLPACNEMKVLKQLLMENFRY